MKERKYRIKEFKYELGNRTVYIPQEKNEHDWSSFPIIEGNGLVYFDKKEDAEDFIESKRSNIVEQ